MKIKIIILLFSSILLSNSNAIKNPDGIKRTLRQAYSLEKNGLTSEAYKIYYELFSKFPHSYEIYEPIKKILLNEKNIEELKKRTQQYLDANNNSLDSIVLVLDVLITLEQYNKIKVLFPYWQY